MQLTKFSNYSLRVLLYLAVHADRLVSIGEVSRAYRVSPQAAHGAHARAARSMCTR